MRPYEFGKAFTVPSFPESSQRAWTGQLVNAVGAIDETIEDGIGDHEVVGPGMLFLDRQLIVGGDSAADEAVVEHLTRD